MENFSKWKSWYTHIHVSWWARNFSDRHFSFLDEVNNIKELPHSISHFILFYLWCAAFFWFVGRSAARLVIIICLVCLYASRSNTIRKFVTDKILLFRSWWATHVSSFVRSLARHPEQLRYLRRMNPEKGVFVVVVYLKSNELIKIGGKEKYFWNKSWRWMRTDCVRCVCVVHDTGHNCLSSSNLSDFSCTRSRTPTFYQRKSKKIKMKKIYKNSTRRYAGNRYSVW